MDRSSLVKMWEAAWHDGLGYAAWQKATSGLSAPQATWKPGPERHSIWQIVNHLVFWHDYTLRALAGDTPTQDEVNRCSWEEPTDHLRDGAWTSAVERFADSHRAMLDAFKSTASPEEMAWHIPHGSYHIGQIMYLRALQGLPPIE